MYHHWNLTPKKIIEIFNKIEISICDSDISYDVDDDAIVILPKNTDYNLVKSTLNGLGYDCRILEENQINIFPQIK